VRTPLIRPGEGTNGIMRIYEAHEEERRNMLRMIDTANATEDERDTRRRGIIGARSAAGDEHRLRMIPAIARGVAGAIPGTAPHRANIG
jgi:hypothetical protein